MPETCNLLASKLNSSGIVILPFASTWKALKTRKPPLCGGRCSRRRVDGRGCQKRLDIQGRIGGRRRIPEIDLLRRFRNGRSERRPMNTSADVAALRRVLSFGNVATIIVEFIALVSCRRVIHRANYSGTVLETRRFIEALPIFTPGLSS